jgi:hypothetical protein
MTEEDRLPHIESPTIRLAQALGQDPAIIAAIADGSMHPIMAAFGLWRDGEDELKKLAGEIERNRRSQPARPPLVF